MNINQIKHELLQYESSKASNGKFLKIPFIMIHSALEILKKQTNMDIYELDYKNIQVYKVVCYVETLLNYLQLEYDVPKNEDDSTDFTPCMMIFMKYIKC